MDQSHDPDFVAAVFSRRDDVEEAVAELRSLGIADEHLGIALHELGQRVFEADIEHDEILSVEEGAMLGIPVGVLAGMGLVALTLPGLGTVAVGGMLAAGGAAGALAGGFLGGLFGLAAGNRQLEESYAWEDYPLQPGEILVVARSHHRPERVREVLQRAGGTIVAAHEPIP